MGLSSPDLCGARKAKLQFWLFASPGVSQRSGNRFTLVGVQRNSNVEPVRLNLLTVRDSILEGNPLTKDISSKEHIKNGKSRWNRPRYD